MLVLEVKLSSLLITHGYLGHFMLLRRIVRFYAAVKKKAEFCGQELLFWLWK